MTTPPTHVPPLRFCIDTSPGPWRTAQTSGDPAAIRRAVDRTLEVARIADQAGIDAIFASEDPDGWDAFAVLSAIARTTEHIRLGTGVVNPYFRHPAQIAASLSTLDMLSNGRAFLGFGRGQSEWYTTAMGMPKGRPLAKLTETIGLLDQWFQPPYAATSPPDATEFQIRAWRRAIGPLQPHVPVYLAAVGPKALKVAARYCDGVILNDLASVTFIRNTIEKVRAEAASAGRDPDSMHFYVRAAFTITDDPEAIYEQRKITVAMIHTLPGMERLLETDGYDIDRIISDVRQVMHTNDILARGGGFFDLREGGDIAAARNIIPTSLMRELTIAGPASHVRERLQEFRRIGVTHVFLAKPGKDATIESIAETIAAVTGDGHD